VRRWLVIWLAASGCYDPSLLVGAPCDPAGDRCPAGQACIAAASGFQCLAEGTPPVVDASLVLIADASADAAIDAVPLVPQCSSDPTLSVCFSFDAPSLTTPLANEGRVPVSADLVNVSRIHVDGGGAALIGTTSSIAIAPNTVIVDLLAIDARIRLDAAVPAGSRVGIIDIDTGPGAAMFVYAGTTTGHRIRCTIAGGDLFADTTIVLGTWTEIACTCDAGKLAIYRDGAKLAEAAGCATASGTPGLQIGQNSRTGAALPPNEQMTGAIDRARMWTAVPPIGP
jgi:hypothetical protein